MWKMLHLLYTLPPRKGGQLTDMELAEAGIDCGPDTIYPMVDGEVIAAEGNRIGLTKSARTLLRTCVLANRRWSGADMWVDYPSAFVVMPFREAWSNDVYDQMIYPGVKDAGLECIRGDVIARVGDLSQNIWDALMRAGLIIADVSALNANVFYEIGLAHGLGKDTYILKQLTAAMPADIGGAHYFEYDVQQLDKGKEWLEGELRVWARNAHSAKIKALLDK
jgi:hypothetical protein